MRALLPALTLLLLAGGALTALDQRTTPSAEESSVSSAVPQSPAGMPLPENLSLDSSSQGRLFQALEGADRRWLPRVEVIPGVGKRYHYQRRQGEPPLTLDEVKRLLANPPSYRRERQAIADLLEQLERGGVSVVVAAPKQKGAAGEWNPRRGELRLRPDVVTKGTREFALVLNHEAIHVAQSCRNGALTARPRLLGLSRQLDDRARRHLREPLYAKASREQRELEEEAYGNQQNLNLGWQLLVQHCRSRPR
jgi:hypothetical protein